MNSWGTWTPRYLFSIAFTVILAACTVFNIYDACFQLPSDQACAQRNEPWTPVSPAHRTWQMLPQLKLVTMSPFFGRDTGTVAEASQKWNELLPVHPIAVPADRLPELGLAAEDHEYVHLPRDETRVLAIPEVFVQLECLNLVRQHIDRTRGFGEPGDMPSFQGSDEVVAERLYLCIERLRTTLMCWSDLGSMLRPKMGAVDGGVEMESGEHAHFGLDFSTRHKCRDMGAITEWMEQNASGSVRMNNSWWGGRAEYVH